MSEAQVRRVDERLGLAVLRAGLSARALVTYARDHVTVRTPSRPDHYDGNTLDLLTVPAPDDLARWVDRFRETIGQLGVAKVSLRWEEPLAAEAPASVPAVEPTVEEAARDLGLSLEPVTVLLLDALAAAPADVASVSRVEDDRRWHAATVLYRYDHSGEPAGGWRVWDEGFVHWTVEVQRELAGAGRADVWLAHRQGAPVARATVVHDRQGLAVVEDVVVHPVHRRRGVASQLVHHAVAHHLDAHPDARIGIGAEPGSTADRLYRRLGFTPHATVWTART